MPDANQNDDQLDLAAQLSQLHDDTFIGPGEVACLVASTRKSVQKLSRLAPDRLPPRVVGSGRLLRWRLGTVRDWIRAQSPPAPAAQSRRVGAPRR
jgi:predicted DNA-binding transcriptional regulator AlpA